MVDSFESITLVVFLINKNFTSHLYYIEHNRERGGSSAVGRGRSGPDRPRPTALLLPRSYGKTEAATAVDRLLMMVICMPETC